MSYSIRIDVKDGKPSLGEFSGTIPEGVFQIGGHKDDHYESLGLTLMSEPSKTVFSTSASRPAK